MKLTAAVEAYFSDLALLRASGGATGERSSYLPLANLLRAVGESLRPKVHCILEPADQGAGHPDFALYAAHQVQKGKPRKDQTPERGVVEVKAVGDDAWLTADSDQVSRYWERYGLVLVTNTRDFVLVGQGLEGNPQKLESFHLAQSTDDFHRKLEKPRRFASENGAALGEYLARALTYQAALSEPKDLAALLASYARDGLARVEKARDTPSLKAVRSALEEALGVQFEAERGTHFFHSTLVQTLFYGVFSAWVLWARQPGPPTGVFDWRTAVWHLRVPVLRGLFQQLSDPGRLQPLGLVDVLDWTAAALNRVDRPAFFARFQEGEAVPYFYEPFLAAFDPGLRKQLGVWYTPTEVVRYMVARVDKALKDDLDIPDGLAADNVFVLDPCCGTGAYLAEALRRIACNLEGQGLGALTGARVKQAAMERVFGFEIMPAPFVVAHLQVGLTMQGLDAPLSDDETERAGVFLTNALTGWEPTDAEKQLVAFPEMAAERDQANQVKRERPILVILGNPPYNGYAGMAVEEERELSQAYRSTKLVQRPEGQGLNDLYVRFFRMAERRIAEKTGQGVVCLISNYSWLDGPSFTGMRERYIDAFDAIRIDCLNGDSRETGKVTPDGMPDPSIFSLENDPVGIQVGTAVTTLVRKTNHAPTGEIGFRHLWGQAKRTELTATAEIEPTQLYNRVKPDIRLDLPFKPMVVDESWFDWPALSDLFPVSFPGVKTSRDGFLVDVDLDSLQARIAEYFDTSLGHEEIARRYPGVMKNVARFDSRGVRDTLLKRGGPDESGFVRFAYRPFDNRWLYWEENGSLLDRPRADYRPHVLEGNMWMVLQNKARPDLSPPLVISNIGDLNQMNSGVYCVPAWLADEGLGFNNPAQRYPNVSEAAQRYLSRLGAGVEDLLYYVVATLHDTTYNEVNADPLRAKGPRIPLPGWPDGESLAEADGFTRSVALGRQLAQLLEPDMPISGVTRSPLRPGISAIAVPATVEAGNMMDKDFAIEAGWGHLGQGDSIMPGKGHAVERAFTLEERAALGDALPALGETTFDVYLNERAFWRNVPGAVWGYRLGGYQVLKKWLSYREFDILRRPLTPLEIQYFRDTARRISALLQLTATPPLVPARH